MAIREVATPANPYSPQYEERRRRAYEFIDEFWVANQDGLLLWIVAPILRALYSVHGQGAEPAGRRVGRMVEYRERTASSLLRRVRPSGQDARYVAVGKVAFVFASENERRKMEPILARGGEPGVVRARPARKRLRELTRRSLRLAAQFEREADGGGVGLPSPPGYFVRQFIGAARHLAYAEALVDRHKFQAVVVGTNHSKPARSLTNAARGRDIPSVYVPHAPLVLDPRENDLPFDFAGLRGPAELDWYRDRGCSQHRLAVVGDPGLEALGLVDIPPSAPIVLALSSYHAELVRWLVSIVKSSTAEPVVVAPHPAQDLRLLREICPPGWEIWQHRTFDLLKSGASAVVQHSSGVALESLLLGLPTIELRPGRTPSNYPLVDPAYVHFAHTSEELRTALVVAQEEGRDESRRRRIQSWAKTWCGRSGEEAAAAGWRLVERAVTAKSAPGPIWDAWSTAALRS